MKFVFIARHFESYSHVTDLLRRVERRWGNFPPAKINARAADGMERNGLDLSFSCLQILYVPEFLRKVPVDQTVDIHFSYPPALVEYIINLSALTISRQ
jgi:hypothetical protein